MNFLDPALTFSDLNTGLAFPLFSQNFSNLSFVQPVEKCAEDAVIGRLFDLLVVVFPLPVASGLGPELDFFAAGIFLAVCMEFNG